MKVLLLGAGGREHALALGLARDPAVSELHAAPGNPGIAEVAVRHAVEPSSPDAVVELLAELGFGSADLVVVGPEAPLVAGVGDAVRAAGVPCFGPSAAAAALEGSKTFAKEIMAAGEVPTAAAVSCVSSGEVIDALKRFGAPYVVKNDGLAAGKGVVVTDSYDEAVAHADACLAGASGGRVVIEEYLDGPEVSLFVVCDGGASRALLPAQDFKRAYAGDLGPNTGGMGAYCPLPWAPTDLVDEVTAEVVEPVLREMQRRGTPFVGLLYVGLALTSRGLRVVEFNARFGDPETEVVIPLLETPLGGLLFAAATGSLAEAPALQWKSGAAVTVVMAAEGYPGPVRSGYPVGGVDAAASLADVVVHQAGTTLSPAGQLVTSGGRILAVTGLGESIEKARSAAYSAVDLIDIAGSHHRPDIAEAVPGRW